MDVLRIKNRYWRLTGNVDPHTAKARIREGLRKANATTERFITELNEISGYKWVGDELFTNNRDHYKMIYSPNTTYLWIITLSTRRVDLKSKIVDTKSRKNSAWRNVSSVIISKA
jgi:hypothetical protein